MAWIRVIRLAKIECPGLKTPLACRPSALDFSRVTGLMVRYILFKQSIALNCIAYALLMSNDVYNLSYHCCCSSCRLAVKVQDVIDRFASYS